ncbi:hypothetical protein N658DRAFT_527257 [Parathielavia hyrcaniae]|uniref:PNPLA domain-containing protein n=1 Tax=Parathielavia hyrcaniae TaxID=113614 RepID=A0AAN6SY54_9PEZI|nr:hypothetical protein N658DRAFT_527257 [Parathielavia hyrcaniae]
MPMAQSLRILCIDGGGIKGYTALLILRRILRTISANAGANALPRPCEIFDLIAGTSTGGLIAVMLGRLHMTVDECIEAYEQLGKNVFGRPVGGQLGRVVRGIAGSPFYDVSDLQEAIRFVLRERGIGPDESFLEKEKPKCKVILCVTRVETGKADLLRNYESAHPTAENYACRIWEAASATAAAPIYFKSVRFASSGERWCDGALRRNNPINEALAELAREPEWQNRTIGCILSLGTGLARSRSISSNLASFLKGALKMLTDAEDTAKVFSASALGRELARTRRYFRFNVPHGMDDLQLDEWRTAERMRALTTDYLSHADSGDSILSCASALLYPDENLQRTLQHKVPLTPHLPCTHFTRRTLYHDRLKAFFSPNMGRRQIFALWGLGGVGKTQIALEFAQSMKNRLSVFWIRADRPGNFIADFSRVMPLISPGTDGVSSEDDLTGFLERTRDRLEELAGDWLLILDNADHLDDFIGAAGSNEFSMSNYIPRRGSILITSRDRRFQGSVAAASDGLCVEPMALPEARDLLLKSVPAHLVPPSAVNSLMASDLVEELGCLPLAIAQAAANIVDQQMSFAEYVGLFREKRRRADLMNAPAYDFANKDARNAISSVATTWKISIDALKRQSPLSVIFLQYLACFHCKEAPQILLRRLPEFHHLDDSSFLHVTKRPLALSLIDQTLDEDPRLSSYSVHPVLHEIMAAELSMEDKRRVVGRLIPVMSRVFPIVPTPGSESWPLAVILAPHLARELDVCMDVGHSSQTVAMLMFSLGRFHTHSRMYNAAADMAEAGLSMAIRYSGPEEDLIRYFRQNAIESFNDAARYDRAELECTSALTTLESRVMTGAIDTKAYNNEKVVLQDHLCVALRGKLNFGGLESIHKDQLRCQQAEQWSAEDVLRRHNLAYGLFRNGKHAKAKDINGELLRYCDTDDGIRVVGKKLHLIMLNLRLLIMRTRSDVWQNFDEIIALYDRIFCETLSAFGIHDRDTWIALNNRLGSLAQAMRMSEMGEVLRAVLPIAIAANVKADGRVAISMGEIQQNATFYLDHLSQGGLEGDLSATAEFAHLLETWTYVSGIGNALKTGPIGSLLSSAHRRLNGLNSHGVYLQYQGRYAEAESVHRRAISELGGADEGLNQLSHYNLMLAIARAGREEEAFAFRNQHDHLITPMEATYGTLEQRQREREEEMRVMRKQSPG